MTLASSASDVDMDDLRYALQQFWSKPVFTCISLVTLGLGIGSSTLILSILNAVLLRPLPYAQPERLVDLREMLQPTFPDMIVRDQTFGAWRRSADSLESLAAVSTLPYNFSAGLPAGGSAGDGAPMVVQVGRVTPNAFGTLGVAPALGRDFYSGDATPGSSAVAILSQELWQRRFSGRSEALGGSLRLDGNSYQIIGVMPPGFELGHRLDLFVPADYEHDAELSRTRGLDAVQTFARLKPGLSPVQAEHELQHIGERLGREFPASYAGWGVKVSPLLEARVSGVRLILWLVAAAVGVLLAIACANVANLLLARASGRTHEIAVRRALGASRRRIARQLLVEGLLLSFVGALCGVLLARAGLGLTLRLAGDRLPRADGIAIDPRVLGSVVLLSLATGLLFGLAPLLHSSQVGLDRALRQGTRGTGDVRALRVRGLLVVAEIALAVVLSSCSLLLVRSFSNLMHVQRGFDPAQALTFDLSLPATKYADRTVFLDFIDRLREHIGALPGVRAVGAAHALPFAADLNVGRFKVQGQPIQDPAPIFYGLDVTPGYFAALGVPLLRGRDIEPLDARQSIRRGIINEGFARRFFPGQDPIGQHLAVVQRDDWYEIIGVV
jgi:putative ABC transport system permease protein